VIEPSGGGKPGVKPFRGWLNQTHGDILGEQAIKSLFSKRSSPKPCKLRPIEVDVANLISGVHARICPPSDPHSKIVLALAEDLLQRLEQCALNRAEIWLLGPTEEVGPVIGQIDPKARKPASWTSGLAHGLYFIQT
jgi:hypothetical protein